jgi:hypothetical protein
VSIDAGKNIESIALELHGDHHDVWIDPSNGDRIIESNDGGVGISRPLPPEGISACFSIKYLLTYYNAMPEAGIDTLIDFMQEFERTYG